jgi:hypothetical protein
MAVDIQAFHPGYLALSGEAWDRLLNVFAAIIAPHCKPSGRFLIIGQGVAEGPPFNPLTPTLGGRQDRSGDTPDPGSRMLHLLVHSLFVKEGFQGVPGTGGHPSS